MLVSALTASLLLPLLALNAVDIRQWQQFYRTLTHRHIDILQIKIKTRKIMCSVHKSLKAILSVRLWCADCCPAIACAIRHSKSNCSNLTLGAVCSLRLCVSQFFFFFANNLCESNRMLMALFLLTRYYFKCLPVLSR